MNKVILCGHLGKDPEVRQVGGGDTVATFSLATSKKWNDSRGKLQEKTEWHHIVAWRRWGEIVGQYLTKGSKVLIEGSLQTRSWDDQKTGVKRYRTEIVLESLEMLGGGDRRDQHHQRREPAPQHNEGRPEGWGYTEPKEEDEDIPF